MKNKNILNMGLTSLAANLWGRRRPLNVMLAVTNRCTAHCSYCRIPGRSQNELSIKEIKCLLDQLKQMGCQRLGLWGGEPLIRDDIGEIIDYAKSKGFFVTLDTNAHLLPLRADKISKLDHLIIGLDGPEQMHDANRGKGNYKKTQEGIKSIEGKIPFWTITVLTKNNLDGIDFILEQAKKTGSLATFQVLHHNDKLSLNQDLLMPSNQDYKKAIKRIIEHKKRGAPIASSFTYLRHILRWQDYRLNRSEAKSRKARCWAGKLYCNIDANGFVYPCSLMIDKIGAVNCVEAGFKKAFDSLGGENSCRQCLASCFTEYNHLYSLDIPTIFNWLKSINSSRKRHAAK